VLREAKSQTALQEEHAGEPSVQSKLWLLYLKKGFLGQFCRLGFLALEEGAVLTIDAQLALEGW